MYKKEVQSENVTSPRPTREGQGGGSGNALIKEIADKKYEYGFTTDVQTDIIEKGLNEDVVRLISEKKSEPEWLLEFRLKAFRHWQTMEQPTWGHLDMPERD